tara:strand:- start:183 stop:719 length:537 start_codon:yes stop_codon:yes gene_type:complete
MASAFHHTFEFDNTVLETKDGVKSSVTLQYCTDGVNNITNCSPENTVTGTTSDKFGICPLDNIGANDARYNVSKPFVMPSQAKDFAFCAICTVCNCSMSLEMSPDGENWCPVVDSSGNPIHYTEEDENKPGNMQCSSTSGVCNCQVINTALMQYIRVIIHDGASTGGKCVATVHWTTF